MNQLRGIVILVLITTLVASLPAFMFVEPPKGSEAFINIILGWFIAKGGDAIAYLLNSTANSAQRNAAMANATDVLVAQATAQGVAAAGGAPGTAQVTVTPPATVEVSTAEATPEAAADDFAIPARP